MNGDLPGVCVWCGEATNRFPETTLCHEEWQARLRLPDCGSHANRSAWASLPFRLLGLGFLFFALALAFAVFVLIFLDQEGTQRELGQALIFVVAGSIAFGLLMIGASLAGYALLIVRDIAAGRFFGPGKRRVRIARLEKDSVTLNGVSPAFAEALRMYRGERVRQ
jgi:hypothetical protein